MYNCCFVSFLIPCVIGHHSLKSPLCQYGCELPASIRKEVVTKTDFFQVHNFWHFLCQATGHRKYKTKYKPPLDLTRLLLGKTLSICMLYNVVIIL